MYHQSFHSRTQQDYQTEAISAQVLRDGAGLPASAVPYVLLGLKNLWDDYCLGLKEKPEPTLKEFNTMIRKARIEGLFDEVASGSQVVVGMSVSHERRGAGIVIKVDSDQQEDKPYVVQFLNGEFCHYSLMQFKQKFHIFDGVFVLLAGMDEAQDADVMQRTGTCDDATASGRFHAVPNIDKAEITNVEARFSDV